MSRRSTDNTKLAGSLLLAHPGLTDPNFRRSVVLLSAHSEDGAMGVILNRPMGKTLGEISGEFALGALADVPVYQGGPVSEKQLILSAWQASEEEGAFRLYFGIDPQKAVELKDSEPGLELRAFLGYAGWSGGQLEGELSQNAWLVVPVYGALGHGATDESLWRSILSRISPEMRLLVEAPDDPELN
ncbi:MAG: YqgE/AlgH family protein [Verrucomicrobia bacterium]|nr:MAG: YqgE/AlgH family protein [Verrucomicrobiota bacterium]